MRVEKAIIVKNLVKKYKLYRTTKERFLDLITPRSYGEDFYALSNIDFEADHGEVVGFVGINGSGKSTLSNIISGIVPETSGTVKVNGQVSLIAVAAGLKNDLTGRDNIELKLLMLGFSKEEIHALEDNIIEFAELEKFIDQPVKSYSSGMKSRLGFAISVNVDPDILVIDEALSVGDKAFAEKSLAKMREFKEAGKTMIFVSHSLGQMKKFCDKILWLEFGMVKDYGDVEVIMPKYEEFLNMWKKLSKDKRKEYRVNAMNRSLDYQSFLKEVEPKKSEYKERLISKIGRVNEGNLPIYRTPKDLTDFDNTKKMTGNTYYIKKQADLNEERFYLLSDEPSALNGTIGWMKATDVVTHDLVLIDEDLKTFKLVGEGLAYNRPWGAKNNVLIKDLTPFKGKEFRVERTDKVRSGYWYFGTLQGEKVWIHQNRVMDMDNLIK